MNQIIINNVNLTDMKAKFDEFEKEKNEIRQKIRQGASKYIADNMKDALKILQELVDEEEEIEDNVGTELAKKACEILKNIQFVSNVSGVSFYLPYYDRQADYYPDGYSFSRRLEDNYKDYMDDLFGLLEDMESDVAEWNASYC